MKKKIFDKPLGPLKETSTAEGVVYVVCKVTLGRVHQLFVIVEMSSEVALQRMQDLAIRNFRNEIVSQPFFAEIVIEHSSNSRPKACVETPYLVYCNVIAESSPWPIDRSFPF